MRCKFHATANSTRRVYLYDLNPRCITTAIKEALILPAFSTGSLDYFLAFFAAFFSFAVMEGFFLLSLLLFCSLLMFSLLIINGACSGQPSHPG